MGETEELSPKNFLNIKYFANEKEKM